MFPKATLPIYLAEAMFRFLVGTPSAVANQRLMTECEHGDMTCVPLRDLSTVVMLRSNGTRELKKLWTEW